MRKNRKGSMELGINSIVILIIALALLGLGIGFITNLFKGGEGNLEGLMDSQKIKVHANADELVVFDPADLTVKANKELTFQVVVYNSLNSPAEVTLELESCVDNDMVEQENIRLVSAAHTIKSGEEAMFKAKIFGGDTDSGTYICSIKALFSSESEDEEYSQQVFIKITR